MGFHVFCRLRLPRSVAFVHLQSGEVQGLQFVESAQVETLNPQSLEHMGREGGKFLMQEHGDYVAADGMWAPGCRLRERVFTYTPVPCAHQQYHNSNP
jgi:hypothetical protein